MVSPNDVAYYKLDAARLPDELFNVETPARKWFEYTTTADASGFPKDSWDVIQALPWDVELERTVGIPLYMMMNVFPFLILPMILFYVFGGWWPRAAVVWVVVYMAVLFVIEVFYFQPHFLQQYHQRDDSFWSNNKTLTVADIKRNQYVWTERNNTKYLNIQFVWPVSVHRPQWDDQPLIFCLVPHAVAPMGGTAYPLWSKLFNDRVCRWTCAPIVLQLPIVGYLVRKIGYIPAKAQNIHETLTKREENVGIILDGIAGMFHQDAKTERACLKNRKGIVKIALKAGAPLVPVYGFGHTALYTVVVDPFGVLEKLSIALQTALTPFFGRFGWFLGPPKRVPVAVVLGEPVTCPQMDAPTQADIDLYHAKLLQAYTTLFEQHKHAYGWGHKTLSFV